MPPLIPLVVHLAVRCYLPRDDSLGHGLFTLAAVVVAWGWAISMIERLGLSLGNTYLLACVVWGAVIAAALLASSLADHWPLLP